jgi:hypothetical protein
MITLSASAQPSLNQLDGFIDRVRSYPVSVAQLISLAREAKAPSQVINFYRSFAPDRVFTDKEDLAGSSEQVDILRQERPEMPKEDLTPSAED